MSMCFDGVHLLRNASQDRTFHEYYHKLLMKFEYSPRIYAGSGQSSRHLSSVFVERRAIFAVLYEFLANKQTRDCRVMLSHNCFTVYYNDTALIDQFLCDLQSSNDLITTYAQFSFYYASVMPGFETGVVYRSRPTHAYRMYLGTISLSDDDKKRLLEYVSRAENEMKFSSNARHIMHRRFARVYSASDVYIDANTEHQAMYLNLLYPGIIRKLAKIEKRINTSISGAQCGQNSSTTNNCISLQAD